MSYFQHPKCPSAWAEGVRDHQSWFRLSWRVECTPVSPPSLIVQARQRRACDIELAASEPESAMKIGIEVSPPLAESLFLQL